MVDDGEIKSLYKDFKQDLDRAREARVRKPNPVCRNLVLMLSYSLRVPLTDVVDKVEPALDLLAAICR